MSWFSRPELPPGCTISERIRGGLPSWFADTGTIGRDFDTREEAVAWIWEQPANEWVRYADQERSRARESAALLRNPVPERGTPGQSLADRVFAAWRAWDVSETAATQEIIRILGGDNSELDWMHERWDGYDRSFEIWFAPEGFTMTDEQRAALGALGFERCWIHHPDGAETYFGLGPVEETPPDPLPAACAYPGCVDGRIPLDSLGITRQMGGEQIMIACPRCGVSMSPEEAEEQRRSFVYGNCKISNPDVTREMVDRAADEIDAAKKERRSCPACLGTGLKYANCSCSACDGSGELT